MLEKVCSFWFFVTSSRELVVFSLNSSTYFQLLWIFLSYSWIMFCLRKSSACFVPLKSNCNALSVVLKMFLHLYCHSFTKFAVSVQISTPFSLS